MTQQELIAIVAEKIQTSVVRTTDVLEVILGIISEELSEKGFVHIENFGVFKTEKRSEFISLNSMTGERLLMPPQIDLVFESDLSDFSQINIREVDIEVQDDVSTKVLDFEPDLSLKNSINSAFINFEPTQLNKGVELPGIAVVSDNSELLENSTLDKDTDSNTISTADISSNDEISLDSVSKDEVKLHVAFKESPPLKPQTNNNRIWMPIMGGVAITLAALFFFNGTSDKKSK